jgi:SOS-response transcriptional repressor LexA
MNLYRDILDAWIDYFVKEWLDKRGESHLDPSVAPFINRLRQYTTEPIQIDDAWHCIEQIERLFDQAHRENENACGRMFLECGIASYKMGNTHDAINFLTRSTGSFADDHNKAIACWLQGCVYWYVNDSISALAFWKDGYRHFRDEATKNGLGSNLEKWYKDKLIELEFAIQYAAEHEAPPRPTIRSPKTNNNARGHTLRTLPVIGQIPAGTPLNILPTPVDFINMERVRVGDKDHCVLSLLRGEKVVNLPQRGQFYYLLRVSGNSMNKCSPEPIEDCDYVILREQYIADNGDIVAAIILKSNGEDPQATLKRYVVRDWKIFLLPESDDPEFQKPVYSQSFSNPNDEFQIRGVAVAVLKPL